MDIKVNILLCSFIYSTIILFPHVRHLCEPLGKLAGSLDAIIC
jgi:hypothetical protein